MMYMGSRHRFKRGERALLLDAEDVPFVAIGLMAEVVAHRGSYVSLIVRDYDGSVIRDGGARLDGVLRVKETSVRPPSALEELADCAEDSSEEC